jgi:3-hydroxyacyl-[acyl-carrier-protein] dehydratase
MKFSLIDRILELEPGKRIVGVKAVSLSEEYLAEHFPTFPVLPGVFMLESMVEAARWLVHVTRDFEPEVVLLKKARGITYKSFVAPGESLRVEVSCLGMSPDSSDFSGTGSCEGREVVKGRFSLTHFGVGGDRSDGAVAARDLVEGARSRWSLIGGAFR